MFLAHWSVYKLRQNSVNKGFFWQEVCVLARLHSYERSIWRRGPSPLTSSSLQHLKSLERVADNKIRKWMCSFKTNKFTKVHLAYSSPPNTKMNSNYNVTFQELALRWVQTWNFLNRLKQSIVGPHFIFYYSEGFFVVCKLKVSYPFSYYTARPLTHIRTQPCRVSGLPK